MKKKNTKNSLQVKDALLILEGTWKGLGTGSYPTIDSFKYREELRFNTLDGAPYIQFEQRAWTINDTSENLIHWETGIISICSNNKLKLYTCHMNGRLEIADGVYIKGSAKCKLIFKSEFVKNNSKIKSVKASYRELTFDQFNLNYMMSMSTLEQPKLAHHLQAELSRL